MHAGATSTGLKMKKLLLLSLLLTGRLLAQPVITTQPTNQIVLSGSDALFNVVATGEGLLTYQWRFNGTNLSKYTITTIAGGGNGGDGGAATSAGLDYPCGVTVDASGNILIAETGNNRIRKVDTNGVITTVAGNDSAGYSGDGSMATNASLNSPFQVAVDGAGNLYIADYDNNRIRKGGHQWCHHHYGWKWSGWIFGRRRSGDQRQPAFPIWNGFGRHGQSLCRRLLEQPDPKSGYHRYHYHGSGE